MVEPHSLVADESPPIDQWVKGLPPDDCSSGDGVSMGLRLYFVVLLLPD